MIYSISSALNANFPALYCSDETAGEMVDSASRFGGRWKIGGGGSGSQTPGQGGCKEDLTYMPTSMFRSRISALSLTASAREQVIL